MKKAPPQKTITFRPNPAVAKMLALATRDKIRSKVINDLLRNSLLAAGYAFKPGAR